MAEEPPTTGEGGVLGNLPHSRPGRRSEKREAGRPGGAARAAARRAEATDAAAKPAGKTSGTRRKARAADPKPAGAARGDSAAGATPRGPIGDAVHMAVKVAGAPFRVAGALAQEVLRRLPRL